MTDLIGRLMRAVQSTGSKRPTTATVADQLGILNHALRETGWQRSSRGRWHSPKWRGHTYQLATAYVYGEARLNVTRDDGPSPWYPVQYEGMHPLAWFVQKYSDPCLSHNHPTNVLARQVKHDAKMFGVELDKHDARD
jgi:hypothetical protein